jgi:hypothetical protein
VCMEIARWRMVSWGAGRERKQGLGGERGR